MAAAPANPANAPIVCDADDMLRMLVQKLKQKRQRASDLFKSIDVSGDGSLEAAELRAALKDMGIQSTDEEFDLFMAKIDKDGGGDVTLKELDRALKAAEKLPPKRKDDGPKKKQGLSAEDKEEIRHIFQVFKHLCKGRYGEETGQSPTGNSTTEWDDSGSISLAELEQLLETVGMRLDTTELSLLLREVDKDHNGRIDFQEFCETMTRKIQVDHSPEDIAKSFKAFAKGAPEGMIKVKDLGNALKTYMHQDLTEAEVEALLAHYSTCFVKIPGQDHEFFNYQDFIDLMSPLTPE